jgi:hypothetical protein
MADQPTAPPNDPSSRGLTDLNTTQQQGVRNLGLLIQAIRTTFPGQFVGVPATATSAGTPNQVAYDATHFYLCISPSVWVRTTLATF